jgi:hypothetical protein
VNIYARISKLHSKSQQREAWKIYRTEQNFWRKWRARRDTAKKMLALLNAELRYTFSQYAHDAARQWLLNESWTAEEIEARLPQPKTESQEMEEELHIVLHESDEMY